MQNLTIGGRAFRAIVESTVEHDVWLTGRLRAAHLDANMLADETAEQFAKRLLDELMGGEAMFDILGAILVPAEIADLEWTPAIARATAATIRSVNDPAEKTVVRGLMAGLLIPFFKRGLASLTVSAPSSAVDAATAAGASKTPGNLDRGTPSSVASPGSTPNGPNGSSAGAFATR